MTQHFIPQADIRRHFLVTGTYSSDQAVPMRDLQTAVERVLMRSFAEPIQIMAYGTPKYHHPYAVDVREQLMKLTPADFQELNEKFPYLMTALLTFFKGAFEPEVLPSTVVKEAMPIEIRVNHNIQDQR